MKTQRQKTQKKTIDRKTFATDTVDRIVLVGVGGTGSYLAEGLAKVIAGYKLDTSVHLIDGDVVTEGNLARQNFLNHEVGANKAEALAMRLNQRYATCFSYNPNFVKNGDSFSYRDLCVSCVDSVPARKLLTKAGKYQLDCGNARDYGQVVFGTTSYKPELKEELKKWNKSPLVGCLPSPECVLDYDNLVPSEGVVGCALTPFDEQGCFINSWVADAALGILHQVLVLGQVTTPYVSVNFSRSQMLPNVINKTYFETYC